MTGNWDFNDEGLLWTLYCSMVENGEIDNAALLLEKHPEMLANLEKDIAEVGFMDDETAWKKLMERINKEDEIVE